MSSIIFKNIQVKGPDGKPSERKAPFVKYQNADGKIKETILLLKFKDHNGVVHEFQPSDDPEEHLARLEAHGEALAAKYIAQSVKAKAEWSGKSEEEKKKISDDARKAALKSEATMSYNVASIIFRPIQFETYGTVKRVEAPFVRYINEEGELRETGVAIRYRDILGDVHKFFPAIDLEENCKRVDEFANGSSADRRLIWAYLEDIKGDKERWSRMTEEDKESLITYALANARTRESKLTPEQKEEERARQALEDSMTPEQKEERAEKSRKAFEEKVEREKKARRDIEDNQKTEHVAIIYKPIEYEKDGKVKRIEAPFLQYTNAKGELKDVIFKYRYKCSDGNTYEFEASTDLEENRKRVAEAVEKNPESLSHIMNIFRRYEIFNDEWDAKYYEEQKDFLENAHQYVLKLEAELTQEQNTSEDASKEVSKDTSKETSKDTSKEASEDVSKEEFEDVSKDAQSLSEILNGTFDTKEFSEFVKSNPHKSGIENTL